MMILEFFFKMNVKILQSHLHINCKCIEEVARISGKRL